MSPNITIPPPTLPRRGRPTPPWASDPPLPIHAHRSRWVQFHFENGPFYEREAFPSAPPLSDAQLAAEQEALCRPWRGLPQHIKEKEEKPKRSCYQRFEHALLYRGSVILILRFICWMFAAIGLGLAASILNFYNQAAGYQPTISTIIAIVVNAASLVYLVFIAGDELYGKPIGLRPARSKMRLLFCDLFFICFMSANLSLQFESVTNNGSIDGKADAGGAPESNEEFGAVLVKAPTQKALACVILIALVAWLLTFAISVARVVERSTRRNRSRGDSDDDY